MYRLEKGKHIHLSRWEVGGATQSLRVLDKQEWEPSSATYTRKDRYDKARPMTEIKRNGVCDKGLKAV